jgi:ketosteroid isomerase-like protein
MSQENVELVRAVFSHYNETGDLPWELIDPEIVYVIDPPAWLAGTYRGHPGLKDAITRTAEVFDEFRFEIDELLPAGDAVVGLGALRVRGALSGAEALQQGASVTQVRNGRVKAVRIYFNRDEALAAVGLGTRPESRHRSQPA